MNILPFPGTNTRTLPFLLIPKKPATTAAVVAALSVAKSPPPTISDQEMKDLMASVQQRRSDGSVSPVHTPQEHQRLLRDHGTLIALGCTENPDGTLAKPPEFQTPDPDIGDTLAALQQDYLTAESAEPGAGWKTGAVLVETWGWEQTNKDFYQITARTPKSITIVPIEAVKTRHKDQPGGTDAMRGTSMPGQSIQGIALLRRKLDMSTGRPFAKVNHGYLDLWKGTPESWTDYA